MNFWNVLKYVLMALFAVVLVVAVLATDSSPTPQTIPQAGQSKFNF
jgi:hypothetical protein